MFILVIHLIDLDKQYLVFIDRGFNLLAEVFLGVIEKMMGMKDTFFKNAICTITPKNLYIEWEVNNRQIRLNHIV